MSLFHKLHPIGARPGTLCVPASAPRPVIRVIAYDAATIDEAVIGDLAELDRYLGTERRVWIDVQGIGDEALLRAIGDRFALHPLLLEDVVNVPQRPKTEEYEGHLFFVTRMIRPVPDAALDDDPSEAFEIEQVGIVLGDGYVLTFQERAGDVLDPVRARLRDPKGPIRSWGADYLAYALLDTIVDHYYPVVERIGEVIDDLEEDVLARPDDATMRRLIGMKGGLLRLRRAVVPQRDALTRLHREGSPRLRGEVLVYLRDTLDHCSQAADVIEGYRELAAGLMNTYLSVVSNRTNEVMKVLTIMASLFIPLTFIAGFYGMNLDALPGAHAPWATVGVTVFMVGCAVAMLVFFRRRGWLGGGRRSRRGRERRVQ